LRCESIPSPFGYRPEIWHAAIPARAIIHSSKLHNFAQMRNAMDLRAAAEPAGKLPHRSSYMARPDKLEPFHYEGTTAQTVATLNLMAREGVTDRNIKAA
jgi:hypothetical protein